MDLVSMLKEFDWWELMMELEFEGLDLENKY